jgi:hypothetical protein
MVIVGNRSETIKNKFLSLRKNRWDEWYYWHVNELAEKASKFDKILDENTMQCPQFEETLTMVTDAHHNFLSFFIYFSFVFVEICTFRTIIYLDTIEEHFGWLNQVIIDINQYEYAIYIAHYVL